jgi:hypothetical protein
MKTRGFFLVDRELAVWGLAACGVLAVAAWMLSNAPLATPAGRLVAMLAEPSGEGEALASTGRGAPLALVISNVTPTQLTPTPGGTQQHARGDCKVQTGSPTIFVVDQTATTTANGFGPFAAGESFSVPTLAWALATGAPGSIRCQFVQDADVGQGGGGVTAGSLDATYLRLDTANDPITGSLSTSFTPATLANPSIEAVGLQDVCIANEAGSRGMCILGTNAASAGDGVTITGSAAALAGRAAILLTAAVSGVSDRFIVRHTSTGGGGGVGVFSIAGNGGLVNESALNGGQLYVADAAGVRTAAGIVTSENAAAGHTLDTTTSLGGATNLLAINNNGTFSAAVDASGTFISEAGNGCGDLSFEVATGSATGMSTNGLHTDLDFCVGGVASLEVSGSRIALGVDVTSGVNVTGANPIVSSSAVGTSGRLRAWNAATTSLHEAAATVGIAGLPGGGQTRVPMQQWRYNESTTPTAVAEVFGGDGLTATFGGLATAVSWTDYGNVAWNGFASTGGSPTALPSCVVARVGRLYSRISNVGGSATSNLCWCGCVGGVCSFTALQGTC